LLKFSINLVKLESRSPQCIENHKGQGPSRTIHLGTAFSQKLRVLQTFFYHWRVAESISRSVFLRNPRNREKPDSRSLQCVEGLPAPRSIYLGTAFSQKLRVLQTLFYHWRVAESISRSVLLRNLEKPESRSP